MKSSVVAGLPAFTGVGSGVNSSSNSAASEAPACAATGSAAAFGGVGKRHGRIENRRELLGGDRLRNFHRRLRRNFERLLGRNFTRDFRGDFEFGLCCLRRGLEVLSESGRMSFDRRFGSQLRLAHVFFDVEGVELWTGSGSCRTQGLVRLR